MGKIFCVEFQRVPLKLHTKYLTPYIERCGFYSQVKIEELLDLRAHKCFWNAPWYLTGKLCFIHYHKNQQTVSFGLMTPIPRSVKNIPTIWMTVISPFCFISDLEHKIKDRSTFIMHIRGWDILQASDKYRLFMGFPCRTLCNISDVLTVRKT